MRVHCEFTADDRVTIELGQRGLIVRYESYRQLGTVNYSVKGYEPFFEGEWLPIARYDNRKGYAQREVVRPMAMTYSALGLHFKDHWGNLTVAQLADKAIDDIGANWESFRSNYDSNFPPVTKEKSEQATRNFPLLKPILLAILAEPSAQKGLPEGFCFTPVPKEDEWLLEQNTNAIGRIWKKALRGELSFRTIGPYRVITHEPPPPEEPETPPGPQAT